MNTGNDPAPKAPLTDARPLTRRDTLLFGLARYAFVDGRSRIRFVWRRVALTLLVAGLLGWLSLAAAAWWFVRHKRGFATVEFLDLALPHRWDDYERKRGDDYLRRAEAALAAQHYREGFQMLRVGVAKSPANVAGRRALADFYVAVGRPDLGIKTLEEGAAHAGDDVGFLRSYLQLLLANHRDDEVLALAGARLGDPALPAEAGHVLALGGALAAFNRGHFDRAEDLLARPGLARSIEARHLLARIEWERGFPELALRRLRALVDEAPPTEEPYATLFGWYRERGRHSEAESVAVLRVIRFPESMQARAGLLYGHRDRGSTERLAAELERMLEDAERIALLAPAVADFAVQSADVALADRLAAALAGQEAPAALAALVPIETRLAARDFAGALERLERLNSERPDWLEAHRATLTGLGAIAHYGIARNSIADLYLGNFLDSPGLRAETLNVMAARLRTLGFPEAARRVCETAVRSDPLNQPALATLVELDLEAGGLEEVARHVPALLAMRRPPRPLLERALRALEEPAPESTARERAVAGLRDALAAAP